MMEVLRQNDNQLIVFKLENKATCEGKDVHASSFPEKESGYVDRSPDFMDEEASTRINQFNSEASDAMLKNPPDGSGLIEEGTKLYMYKAVAYIEQPETKVHSNDEVCPALRNSCSDEGSVSHSSALLENNEVKVILASNRNTDINGQIIVGPPHSLQELEQTSTIKKAIEVQNSLKSIVDGEETNTIGQVKNQNFAPNITLEELLLQKDSDSHHGQVDPIYLDFGSNHKQCIDHEKIEQTETEDASSMTTLSCIDPKFDENTGANNYPSVDTSEFLRERCSISPEMISDSTSSDHSGIESNPHTEVELVVSDVEATAAMEKGEITVGEEPLQVQNLIFSTNHSKTEGNLPEVGVEFIVSKAEATAATEERRDDTDSQEALKVQTLISDSTPANCSETEGSFPADEVEPIVPAAEATTDVFEEIKENADTQKNLQFQDLSVSQSSIPDATADPPRSSFSHSYHADLIVSGPRTSSGRIPYSGSISMRSDSSTTSTHSFAFPILQREWNTSPVKMAKARRKQRWRFGLNCCKF